MALLFCVFLCACAGALGFNVDIPSRVIYKGNHQSMFGFTVQSHIDGGRKMILVGAPEDQPSYTQGVSRPGAVYRCEPTQRGRLGEGTHARPLDLCSEMLFDAKKTNNVDMQNHQIDQKSNQWFGATLTSTGRNGPIVACAPRYVSFVSAKLNQRDPVGTCFVAKTSDASKVEEISPCRTTTHGQRKTGLCQAGFSAAVSNDGERLFLGAPGSFYWQGQLYTRNTSQVLLIATPEASSKNDDSYMGYSIAVGDFVGHGIQGVAVGVPRGSNLEGLVALYTRDLKNFKNLTGSQIGSYFGYSLASGDIDGDGNDDIIIGAPMFARKKSDGYEHGRVYVVYQGQDRSFTRHHFRTGEISRGRFGLAITSLGDINLDGFGDVAIGAPYGGENGRGVVFIYLGGRAGISEKASQVITAEEISPTLSTFGFSLSGGVDLDSNNYTDLAVGAYKSDSIIYLKSRPVVKVMAEVKFMGESKTISLTDKDCTLANGTQVACADVMFCLTYNGINVDQQINFEVTLDLDSRQKTTKRLFLLESGHTMYKTHILLTQGQQECRDVKVYIDEDFRDKLTPIEVKMTYELITQPSGSVVPPVLDQTEQMEHTDSLNIPKNCGADNICIPDLRLAVTTPTINYLLGSGDNVNLDVKVENAGEDAFEAAYYLRLPAGVTYANMQRPDDDKDTPIYCSVEGRDFSGNTTLKCDMGNPMPSGQKVRFRVVLEVDARVTALVFDMEANSTNPEQDTQYDNGVHLNIGVIIRAQLSVIGTSDPPELHYNASLYDSENLQEESKLGPQVIHKYNIKNEGFFTIDEAEIYVMWPYQTLTGESLMYVVEQPQWLGAVTCGVARHVNSAALQSHAPGSFLLSKEREAMVSSDLYSGMKINMGGGYYGQNMWESSSQYGGGQLTSTYTGGSQSGSFGGGQTSGGHYSTSHSSSGKFGTGQSSGGHFGTAQTSGGQYGTGQSSGSQYGTGQSSGIQFGTSQSGGYYGNGQSASTHYGTGHSSGSQNGGHVSGSTTYNKNWSDSYGDDLTVEQQEEIRRALAAAANNPSGGIQDFGQGGGIVRVKNRTIFYDENGNIVSQLETSTEYGSLGHEGEAGSSFNIYTNRHGANAASGSGQSYSQNSGQVYGQNSNNRFSHGSSTGFQSETHGQGSRQSSGSSGQGFVHGSWGTTETVNSDVMNAGSATYRGVASVTKLGDDDDDLDGFAANAARNPNNEFKIGMAEVSHNQGYGQSGGVGNGGNQGGVSYQTGQAGSVRYQSGGASQSAGSHQTGASSHSSGGYQMRSGEGYTYSAHSGGQSSYSSSYGNNYGSASQQGHRTRRRRQDQVDPHLKEILEKCEEKYKCEVLRCTTGRLIKGQEVWLALKSRINASVLNEISKDRPVILSSLAAARVSRLGVPGGAAGATGGAAAWRVSEARTVVSPQLEARDTGAIPLWVIILAAVIGALVLLLLIFILYKCGFFKRNRPSDHAERQPLNGRDEHL